MDIKNDDKKAYFLSDGHMVDVYMEYTMLKLFKEE